MTSPSNFFYVVEMPYNSEGQGPEMDPSKVVGTHYEIWDQILLTCTQFSDKDEADRVCKDLNLWFEKCGF